MLGSRDGNLIFLELRSYRQQNVPLGLLKDRSFLIECLAVQTFPNRVRARFHGFTAQTCCVGRRRLSAIPHVVEDGILRYYQVCMKYRNIFHQRKNILPWSVPSAIKIRSLGAR
jgi:hypothetical protein